MKFSVIAFLALTSFDFLSAEARLGNQRSRSGRPLVAPVRTPSSTYQAPSTFKAGLALGLDGLWGKVSSSDVSSRGLGYSLGVTAQIKFMEKFRVLISPSYNYMRLGRPFDSSGQLEEPTPANLDQSVKSIGIGVIGSYELEGGDSTAPVWWVDVGGQYLMPLSAAQTMAGSDIPFTANKSFLVLLGVSLDYALDTSYELLASLHGLYSLGSSEGKMFGMRVLAGISFRI